jgi:hypothetical protein
MIRPLAVTGLVLATAVAVAGCKESTTAAPPAAGPAAAASTAAAQPPQERLAAAVRKLGQESVKVKMTMGSTMSGEGRMDPKHRQGTMRMSMSLGGTRMTTETILVGADAYTRFDSGPLAGPLGHKWLHLDARKAASGQFGVGDPEQVTKMVSALSDLKADGPDYISGKLDLAKASPLGEGTVKFGGAAKPVPFTARVDDQGRLTQMTMDMSAASSGVAGVGKMIVSYSDFGITVTVHAPPKRDTRELPKDLSGLLGG